MAEATHHHFNTFMIMCRTMNCLKSWLSPLAECVAWLLFHFRNMAAVFIYVAAAHTSASLYFPLLHPGWNCYQLLVTVFLPKCMFTVIPLGNRQSFIVDNPNWIDANWHDTNTCPKTFHSSSINGLLLLYALKPAITHRTKKQNISDWATIAMGRTWRWCNFSLAGQIYSEAIAEHSDAELLNIAAAVWGITQPTPVACPLNIQETHSFSAIKINFRHFVAQQNGVMLY